MQNVELQVTKIIPEAVPDAELATKRPRTPMTFGSWKGNGMPLFLSDDGETTMHFLNVFVGELEQTDLRQVFGWARVQDKQVCRFFVALKAADVSVVLDAYLAWLRNAPKGPHTYLSDPPGQPPPRCGAPGGPPCM